MILYIFCYQMYGLQELLRHYGMSEEPAATTHRSRGSREGTPTDTNTLFQHLPDEIQNVVRPYLDSKFQLQSNTLRATGVIFKPDMSFRRWLASWMRQLTEHHASGLLLPRCCLAPSSSPLLLPLPHLSLFTPHLCCPAAGLTPPPAPAFPPPPSPASPTSVILLLTCCCLSMDLLLACCSGVSASHTTYIMLQQPLHHTTHAAPCSMQLALRCILHCTQELQHGLSTRSILFRMLIVALPWTDQCPALAGADWYPALCCPAPAGELLAMFKACMPVIRCDIQSARFLMPYLLQCVISTGSSDSRKGDPTSSPTCFRSGQVLS